MNKEILDTIDKVLDQAYYEIHSDYYRTEVTGDVLFTALEKGVSRLYLCASGQHGTRESEWANLNGIACEVCGEPTE